MLRLLASVYVLPATSHWEIEMETKSGDKK